MTEKQAQMISINEGLTRHFEWLNGRPLYASVSGGKDSGALCLWMQARGLKFTPIFIDTGFEHEKTYQYIDEVLKPRFGDFITLRNEKYFQDESSFAGGMEQLIAKHKMFPNGRIKFCTRELKISPIQNFYSEIYAEHGVKPINALGIRGEESFKRSKLGEVEEQDEATVWRPLIDWSYDEVVRLHNIKGLAPNPLYLKGASRVGCYPCIFARKHEIRHMALSDPARVEHLRNLEVRITGLRSDGQEATFFKSKKKDKDKMNILEIVEWSKSSRGERLDDQVELEDSGCMRWGLCDLEAKARNKAKEEVNLFNWRDHD